MIVNGFELTPSFYLKLNPRRRLQVLIKFEDIVNGFNIFAIHARENIPAFQPHIVKNGVWPDACQTESVRFSISEIRSYSNLFHKIVYVLDGRYHLRSFYRNIL